MGEAIAKPIPFTGPLLMEVRADRKTVTRRPIAGIPDAEAIGAIRRVGHRVSDGRSDWLAYDLGGKLALFTVDKHSLAPLTLHCRYGEVGGRLWVRESIRRAPWGNRDDAIQYVSDGDFAWDLDSPATWVWKPKVLAATYCPRGLSRLMLEITAIRAERVQDITEEDARAEGVAARAAFLRKWDEIYGQGAADKNPWVWRIAFRRLTSVEPPAGPQGRGE